MLKPKEILLADGVTYAPAFVSVNADGSINTGGGNTTMGNITLNATGLASSAEQSNQTVLLTAIRNNTANSSTNITTLSTAARQDQQNANLSVIANQTVGLATLTVQNNHTGLLQSISNNTANHNVTVINNDIVASHHFTANGQELVIDTTGKSTLSILISGTDNPPHNWLEISRSIDGINWQGFYDDNHILENINNLGMPFDTTVNVVGFIAVRIKAGNDIGGSLDITTTVRATSLVMSPSILSDKLTQIGLSDDNPISLATDSASITSVLKGIFNNTANGSTNITTLSTAAKQDQQNANLILIANQTLGGATATHQVNQTTLLTNLTTAAVNQSTSLTTLTNLTSSAIFRTDNTPTLTALGSTGAWIDAAVNGQTKFELVLALGTAATVPVLAFQADYSIDGSAIVETTQTLTGVASSAVSLGGIEGKPTRVRCVVKTAGVTLGTGAKVIITGSK